MKLTCLVGLALVVTTACSKDKPAADDGKVASCHIASLQTCREYRGDNLAMGTAQLQELCTTLVSSAKFTDTPCPTDKTIGTCAKPEGKDYFYEGYAGTNLEAACAQGGGTFATK